jgi:acyl-CoA thioester hydrolase
MDVPPQLAEFPVVLPWPVQWGDEDSFGHVNNTVYIRWFESARIEYLNRTGLSELHERQRIGPILASITCHFRRPVEFPDRVLIGARVTRFGRTSFTMAHCIVSEAQKAVAAEGDSIIVVFDYNTGKPHPIPDAVRQAIERLEGKSFSSAAPTT